MENTNPDTAIRNVSDNHPDRNEFCELGQSKTAILPMPLSTKYIAMLKGEGKPYRRFHWRAMRDGRAPVTLEDARKELLKWEEAFGHYLGAPSAVVAGLDTDEVLQIAIEERWKI